MCGRTFKSTGNSTGESLLLIENLTAPGGGPPPHIHTREDEFFYVLDGTFEIRIGDELHALAPGGFAYVPRETVHNFRNTAETASRILVGFTPAGIEGFFRESGRSATDDGPAPPLDELLVVAPSRALGVRGRLSPGEELLSCARRARPTPRHPAARPGGP